MKLKLYWIISFIIFGCSTKMIESNNKLVKVNELDETVVLKNDYQKMIIGTWEMDSLSTDGMVNKNGRWIEIYNNDSSFCFFPDKSFGETCDLPKKGTVVMYGFEKDVVYQYDVWKEDQKTFTKYKPRKILTLTDSILVYKSIGIQQEQIHYYHRIR